ncbi:MAG: 7-cyano-7-deazaguanine synthase QueC [Deltaproteobacteria bacterium CG11_big_fil_rev_8_21_14_0_20_47_16]|nr:MAG: 7-cyano-7-deazaguanine synthase QueC [Deltaproteobacteria bacterium CG11_big_fil_rev_8_21_14_0_20_47_16]
MDSCLILLSGGLDSVVATAMVRQSMPVRLALTFDYGQRAAPREIATAQKICAQWDIPHQLIEIPWLGTVSQSALNKTQHSMPHLNVTQLDSLSDTIESASKVWVPNRNGVFLNIAAAIAEANGIQWIVTGFNREEAVTFPDNSPAYVNAANTALRFSTMDRVSLISPTQGMVKSEIATWAKENAVPLNTLWPCYEAGDSWCRKCESCLRFIRATGL